MAHCEDWPCCGHEAGCCPDYDESGRQLNMICICGAKLPIDNPVSICDACLHNENEDDWDYDGDRMEYNPDEVEEHGDDMDYDDGDDSY